MSAGKARRSRQAPAPRPQPSTEELRTRLDELLAEKYLLPPAGPFWIVTEGTTDVAYLKKARDLELARSGRDLLTASVDGADQPIEVVTPRVPQSPTSGGTPQVIRLARHLAEFRIIEPFKGLVFVLDKDSAGDEAEEKIVSFGFRSGVNTVMLDPKHHPSSAGVKDDNVVEDLLSLDLQCRFFEGGARSVVVTYVEGSAVRFQWKPPSKGELVPFALEHATVEDLEEIVRLLERVRAAMGVPA